MDLIQASRVSKHFGGVVALREAEFHARAGEIHALIGENGAGKSTFIQVLAGAVHANSGTILLAGEPFAAANPSAAQDAGISAVFQELSLIPDLTVERNIWFRREPMSRWATVQSKDLRRRTLELLERYEFPPMRIDQEVRRLTLAERQLVEIAKALARDPQVLILDEATSALAPRETEWLLRLARRFATEGGLVVYISHRLAEVRDIADRLTVFRNGETVAAHDVHAVSDDEIIAEMLGRRMERLYPERVDTTTGKIALKVRNLAVGDRLQDASFDLKEGEVLGVGGLQGHGQRELFQALFGIGRARGEIELWGKRLVGHGPRHVMTGRDGIAFVPEDRRGQGLLLSKSVRENLTLSVVRRFSRFGFLSAGGEAALVDDMIRALRIKTHNPGQLAGTLSGGNQQKVIFGKMLLTEARVILLYDPTRGVDVGTKGEIFQLMRDLASRGYAILFYSSDLPELVHVADRVAVMRNGRIGAILEGEAISEEAILRAAMTERGQLN